MMRHPEPRVRLHGERAQIFLPAEPTGEWRRMGHSRQTMSARRIGVAIMVGASALALMGAVIHAA